MKTTNLLITLLLTMLAVSPLKEAGAQVFHFNNTSTTLQLDTSQTPAHWYIQIYNDVGVDTTLRWKSLFSNIPVNWDIQLDVETGIFQNIQSGDSADFILKDSMLFPQKLIIGAFTNNTPATGSVFFDIYDPATPAGKVTIEFYFIITAGGVGIQEPAAGEPVVITPGQVFFSSAEITAFSIYSGDGKVMNDGWAQPGWNDLPRLPAGMYVMRWHSKAGIHHRKWIVTSH